jgi:hypothetical protein
MPASNSNQLDKEPYSLQQGVRPVVILGAARSGTKFLRGLLEASSACAAIPHGVNFVWRRGHHDAAHDAVPPTAYSSDNIRLIRKTLLRLSRAARFPDIRFIVERTCANTLRLPAVHAVLPDARYLHIVRDGRDVAASAYEQWTTSPSLRHRFRKLIAAPREGLRFVTRWLTRRISSSGGWGPHYPGMRADLQKYSTIEVCALQWKACVETCQNDLVSLLPPTRYLTIRYEQLVKDVGTIREVCSFLEISDSSAVLDRYRNTVRADSVERWKRTLAPRTRERIQTILAPTLKRLEYSP